ncbi:hypothetical protein [Leptolyngbya sp. 7M]|uniref:hypothetical protein n=1 Tax=Leptolyngbya sp. 7M TaxID=2812896 RepID=UPI001CECA46B|nr:hypothetical protein [Leptolyngbya sp. 7M]
MKELDEKKMELLCDSVLFGLTEDELGELEDIDRSAMSSLDAQELELTAARLSLIGIDKDAQLPQHLFDRIAADAIKHIARSSSSTRMAHRRLSRGCRRIISQIQDSFGEIRSTITKR